ncbi:MAG: anti-sigma factor antagonist [Oscillospiraceae bacterium]|jgi:stage II sporulation protein AA (anti-sigma F factor antagonist)|nr:anti-sigma factor antagonist [Oscillospiraceae bacterium]
MRVTWELRGSKLFVYLSGELDHHAAHQALKQMGDVLDEHMPLRCVLDLSGLSFMDSSGIAVVLGTYRRLKSYGGELSVAGVPNHAAKVLTMAGVDRLVPIATATKG